MNSNDHLVYYILFDNQLQDCNTYFPFGTGLKFQGFDKNIDLLKVLYVTFLKSLLLVTPVAVK